MKLTKKNLASVLLIAGAALLASVTTQAQPRADLSEGTLTLDGSLSVNYLIADLENPTHVFHLKSDAGVGYFVMDNLLVGGSLPVNWAFSEAKNGTIGLSLLSTYFFDIDSVMYPHLGVNVTPGFDMGASDFRLSAGIEAGVLVSMSESVALDLGIRPEISFPVSDNQKWRLSIPAGYMGVRAFF